LGSVHRKRIFSMYGEEPEEAQRLVERGDLSKRGGLLTTR
jgi:hypothetical protein